jgi:hypothetical protein
VGFVGKGRIVSEHRTEPCGTRSLWHVVLFMDDEIGRERAVGASKDDLDHARAIKARWEKLTLADFAPAPIKTWGIGQRSKDRRRFCQ